MKERERKSELTIRIEDKLRYVFKTDWKQLPRRLWT
jgi:hypothetical protein